jgi:transcriptional regulator with XRE-family HTH domain
MNQKLRDARKKAGLTQIALAERAESTEGRIVAFERMRFNPHPDEAQRIADVLGVRVEKLFQTREAVR